MYGIIKDIWKNPGAAFSAMPRWNLAGEKDADVLTKQLDSFHKKGIDAVLLERDAALSTEENNAILARLGEEAKKRFMLLALTDSVPTPNMANTARLLCARPANEPVLDGEDVQFCVFVKREGELLVSVSLAEEEGYEPVNLLLKPTEGEDVLSPVVTEALLSETYEKDVETLAPYLGQTFFGFYATERMPVIRDGLVSGVSFTYGMIEDYLEAGGDIEHLTALFYETKEKKLHREAEYLYRIALRNRLKRTYYHPLAAWCEQHGLALLNGTGEVPVCDLYAELPIPAVTLRKDGDRAADLFMKANADFARTRGTARNAVALFGGETAMSPDGMMCEINRAVACGANMLIPEGFSANGQPDNAANGTMWDDYRVLGNYMKRMAWLGAMGTDNPEAAVLCSADYIPVNPAIPLIENGYSFHYLSVTDFMERAHIHDGTVRIDRYSYGVLLVDGRLRLDSEIVKKIGQFAIEGGKLFRGSDFIGTMRKFGKRTSYLDGEGTADVRFLRYTKSGCPFFVLFNESETKWNGNLVTSLAHKAERFDAFTGKTSELAATMHEDGFAYPVSLGAHESLVIGMDPSSLPLLAKDGERDEKTLAEIVSLGKGRMTFEWKGKIGRHALLSLGSTDGAADITVNGRNAGRFLFRPYEKDISSYIENGTNTVELTKNGKAVSFASGTVRISDNPAAEGTAYGEQDELWDLYDKDRNPLGRTHRRGDAMGEGEYHVVVHIWLRNAKGEFLLSKRSPDKNWPLVWECTGGSALAGEDSLTAAMREVREELGITLDPDAGRLAYHADRDDYFGDIWLFDTEFDLSKVKLQDGETVDARIATLDEIRSLLAEGRFIPYHYLNDFFKTL